MQYFFYGTLCDSDVRQLVLGYHPGPRQLRPARLAGFRRKQAQDQAFPVLIRSPGGRVEGLLFTARPADSARLAAYEGPEYRTCRLPIRLSGSSQPHGNRRALVFLPASSPDGTALPASLADWQFRRWRRRDKAAFLASLQNRSETCAHPLI